MVRCAGPVCTISENVQAELPVSRSAACSVGYGNPKGEWYTLLFFTSS